MEGLSSYHINREPNKTQKNKEIINEEFKKHKTIKCISSPPKGFEKKMKCNLSKKKQVPTPLVLNA